jgi:hypothetical protein
VSETVVDDKLQLPEVSQALIDMIFEKLATMTVELYENPLEFGPKPLANKIVDARCHLDDTEEIFLNVSHWIQKYKAAHRAADVCLTLGKKHLMANDPETRAGRNLTMQDAIASMKLKDEVAEVAEMAAVLDDLTAVLIVIKAKRADLKDTQTRIRDLQKLCGELIGLGGRWGSRPLPGVDAPDLNAAPKPDAKSFKELHAYFHGAEVKEEQLGDLVPPEATPGESEEPEPPLEASEKPPEKGNIDESSAELLDSILGNGAEEDPDTEEAPPKDAGSDDLTQYDMVGFCLVDGCGKPVYNTPSGSSCGAHGGAPYSEDDPNDPPVLDYINPKENPLEAAASSTTDEKADEFLEELDATTPLKKQKKSGVDLDKLLEEFGI